MILVVKLCYNTPNIITEQIECEGHLEIASVNINNNVAALKHFKIVNLMY